jgi:putative inorganic carbon (HCO3(-)) transporter
MSVSQAPANLVLSPEIPQGSPEQRRFTLPLLSFIGLGIIGLGIAYIASVTNSSIYLLAAVIALPVAVLLAYTALWRFEWFLLGLLAIRATLDVFANPDSQGGVSLVVTGMFGIFGGLWLFAQWRSHEWTKPSSATKSLYWFVAAGLLSCCGSAAPLTSLVSVLKLSSGVLMFSVIEQHLSRHPEAVRRLVGALLFSLIPPIILGLYQNFVDTAGSYYADVSRVEGTFVHPTPFSEYLVTLMLLLLPLSMNVRGTRAKWIIRIALGFCGALEIFTYTRTGWIALLVALLYLGFKGYKKMLIGLVISLVVLVAAVPSIVSRFSDLSAKPVATGVPANSFSWRVNYWGQVLPLANSNPVTGLGFDMVQHTTDIGLQPHNIYVETYTETGLVGCAALIGVILSFGRTLRRRARNALTPRNKAYALSASAIGIAFLTMGLGENLLVSPVIFWYVAAAMTFGLGRAAELRGEQPRFPFDATPTVNEDAARVQLHPAAYNR